MMMWLKIYSVLALTTSVASAQTGLSAWEAGLVLDTALSSSKPELAARDQGAGLGHSDVLLRGPLGPWFSAEVIGSFHTVDQKLETHWENAWVQTRGLPAGWQVRAGRFASQVGYWNEIHPHADDFAERGLLQRAFLGGHWVDDGVRVNWTAPTDFYLRLGMESMSGRRWLPESTSGGRVNTYSLKIGHDWGAEHSWQWGLSRVNNRREAHAPESGAEAGHNDMPAEGLRQALEFQRHLARRPLHRELDVGTLDVRSRELGCLQPLDFLAPRRRLAGARAGAEPRDELVELRDLLLALLVLGFDLGANLRQIGRAHV